MSFVPQNGLYGRKRLPAQPGRCIMAIFDGWQTVQCSRKATRDSFCAQHHPDTDAAKQAKREAELRANNERWEKERLERAQREHRAACFEQLVQALRDAEATLEKDDRYRHAYTHSLVRAALERAEGGPK